MKFLRRYNPHRIRSRDVSRSFRNFQSKQTNQYDAELEDPMKVENVEAEFEKLRKENVRLSQKLDELNGI